MLTLARSQWSGTREELEARVAAFVAAKAAHALTINVPAPTEDPIIERLAATGEGFELEAELEEPAEEE